jgi:hypothetical protein
MQQPGADRHPAPDGVIALEGIAVSVIAEIIAARRHAQVRV